MKALTEFLKSINPYAPGCAAPTAYHGIREACIEFCERTRMWRHEDTFDVTEDEAEGITAPANSVFMDIERLAFEGVKLEAKTVQWLDDNMEGWRTAGTLTGLPQYFTQLDINTIRLVPWQAGTVDVSMWLKPSEDCTSVPDFLPDQHRETIARGALGRILLLPGQPFTNPKLASAFLQAFDAKLDKLSGKGFTGQQRAVMRTKASFM